MPEEKFWKVLETHKGFKGNWVDINLDKVLLPDNTEIEFEAICFHRNGTGVVAENDKGEIVLVKNYRYINDFYSWEIPAGTIPPGMDAGDCVLEELKEEAGCVARKDDLTYLGKFYPSIGSSDQIFYCYHARNVQQEGTDLDKNEILEAKWFTKEEIKLMINDEVIKDGFSLNVLMRYLFLMD